MSRFACNLCNREFTTKYGLQKHSNKKIPCTAEKKTNHQCNICNKFLRSKQNLDNHLCHCIGFLTMSNHCFFFCKLFFKPISIECFFCELFLNQSLWNEFWAKQRNFVFNSNSV